MADLDLKDALTMFHQGMQEYSQGQNIRAAQAEQEQIKANQEIDDKQRTKKLLDVSNSLGLNLLSSGAGASGATTAMSATNPLAHDIAGGFIQAFSTGDAPMLSALSGASEKLNQIAMRKAEMQANIDAQKEEKVAAFKDKLVGKRLDTAISGKQKEMESFIKGQRERMDNLNSIEALIQTRNPIAPEATKAMIGRIHGLKGRIPLEQQQAAATSQDFAAKIEDALNRSANSEFGSESRKAVLDLVKIYRKHISATTEQTRQYMASGLSKLPSLEAGGYDAKYFYDRLPVPEDFSLGTPKVDDPNSPFNKLAAPPGT